MGSHRPPVHILIVEDDDVDAEHLQRCLHVHNPALPVTVVATATTALVRLRGQEGAGPLPQPCIILLTLYLPGMSGMEFLQALRQDPNLKRNVVFVVNDSASEPELAAAYELNIAGYFLKAKLEQECESLARIIDAYQLMVHFPEEDA